MKARQLTWNEAEAIAEAAVDQAGFAPDRDKIAKLTVDENIAAARKFATAAAKRALRLAGLLESSDAADRIATNRAATAAEQRHSRWKRATGARF